MNTPAHRYRNPCKFIDIGTGELFELNGNVLRKKSARTAEIYWPAAPARRIRIGKNTACHSEGAA